MTISQNGHTGVSILAGPLRPSIGFPDSIFYMGETTTISIDPDTAKQWIETLSTITEKSK